MGVKISELNEASSVQNSDVLPIVQNGETKKVSASTLFNDINNEINGIQEQINPTNWINATLGSGISGIVRYAKIGRLVIVEIRELASTTNLTDTGAVIATGLPKSIASTLFVVSLMTATTTSDPNCRLQLSVSGNITLFYDKMYAGSSSAQYYGQLVYISDK